MTRKMATVSRLNTDLKENVGVMLRPTSNQVRHLRFLAGCWLAAIALAVHMAAASMVPWEDTRFGDADWLIANAICYAGDAASGDHQTPARHPTPKCPVCPLCQAIAHAGPLLIPPGPILVPPVPVKLRVAMPPPVRAPPIRMAGAAFPRGPPVLV